VIYVPLVMVSEPLDIIVMIDTSSSMEPYFDNLLKYLFINTLNNNMYLGDRFHLLCFASYPSIELAETLKDENAIKSIQKEITFLKGRLIFGEYTDLLSALKLVIAYAGGLSPSSPKKILLLSDGIHDPPPDSPYANFSPAEAISEVQKYVQTIIDKNGWSIRFLRLDELQLDSSNRINTGGTLPEQSSSIYMMGATRSSGKETARPLASGRISSGGTTAWPDAQESGNPINSDQNDTNPTRTKGINLFRCDPEDTARGCQ